MRRTAIVLAVLLGCLLLAAAAIWLFRLSLAQQGLAYWLRDSGLAASARIVHLDSAGVELRDVVLADQSIARLAIRYDLPRLLFGGPLEHPPIAAVEVEGLRLHGDLTAERPFADLLDALERVTGPPEPTETASTALPALPPLILDDAQLDLVTALGPLLLRLDGSLGIAELPADVAPDAMVLDLAMKSLEGPLPLSGQASGLYRPGDGEGSALSLRLASDSGPPVRVAADLAIADGIAELALDLAGEAGPLAALAPLPFDALPAAGTMVLNGGLRTPAAPLLAGRLPVPAQGSTADGTLSLRLTDLNLPGLGRDIDLALELTHSEAGGIALGPVSLSAASLEPEALRQLDLPPQAGALLAGGGWLSIAGRSGPPAVLTTGPDGAVLRLDLDADLSLHAGGRMEANLDGAFALPPPPGPGMPLAEGRAALVLNAVALDLPGLLDLEHGRLAMTIEAGPDGLALALSAPAELEGLRLAPTAIANLDQDWQPLLLESLDARLAPPAAATIRLRPDAGDLEAVHLALAAPVDIRIGEAEVAGMVEGRFDLSGGFELRDMAISRYALSAQALATPHGRVEKVEVSGAMAGRPSAASGTARLALDLREAGPAGTAMADLRGELAAALDWDGQVLRLALAEPGSLLLANPTAPFGGHVRRLELAVAEGSLALAPDGLDLQAVLSLPATGFDPEGGGRIAAASLAAGRIDLGLTLGPEGGIAGLIGAEGVTALLADPALSLRGGRLSLRLEGEQAALELAAGRLLSGAEPPLFPELDLSGTAALAGDNLTYRGRARGLGGALAASLEGGHDLARDRGRADLLLSPLTFAPGTLQPGDLMAGLTDLQEASGSLSARAALQIGGGRLDGSGQVRLDGIGFTIAGNRVQGVDMVLDLTALDPPASQPGQRFSVDRVDAGIPLNGLTGRFQLTAAQSGPLLLLERAEAGFLGGRLVVENAVLDPLSSHYDLVLRLRQLDLEALLAATDLEEVSGTGRLSGEVPIRIDGAQIVIAAGRLDAQAPGRLSFRSEGASQALAAGGEAVELMMQALDDFHYDRLGLSLDKPATGDSQVLLRLEGANPAVLDGQPFIFNINLTSDAAPLLEALAAGTAISDRLLGQVLRGRSR